MKQENELWDMWMNREKKVNDAAFRNQIIKKKEKILPAYRETIFKKCAYGEKWLKCAGKT